MPLTAQQMAFALHFAAYRNGADAARRAGYSPRRAKITACELLKRPEVQQEIARYRVEGRTAAPDIRLVKHQPGLGQEDEMAEGDGHPPTDPRPGAFDRDDPRILDRNWVIARLMHNVQVCLGEVPIKITRITKLAEGGAEVFEAVTVEIFAPDPARANAALKLLRDEVDRREAAAQDKRGAGRSPIPPEFRDHLIASGRPRRNPLPAESN